MASLCKTFVVIRNPRSFHDDFVRASQSERMAAFRLHAEEQYKQYKEKKGK